MISALFGLGLAFFLVMPWVAGMLWRFAECFEIYAEWAYKIASGQ